MKKLIIGLILLTVFSVNNAMALTVDEAKQMYTALQCHRVEGQSTTDDCDLVKCDLVEEMVKMSVVDWDNPETDPVPEPEPEPEPTPDPVPDPEPECIATWCSLPLQDCGLEPLTGGTDSCGNPCSKPSPEWPNCKLPDGSIGQIQ